MYESRVRLRPAPFHHVHEGNGGQLGAGLRRLRIETLILHCALSCRQTATISFRGLSISSYLFPNTSTVVSFYELP